MATFKIRNGFEEIYCADADEAMCKLSGSCRDRHVSVHYKTKSGIILTLYVSVDSDGVTRDTYTGDVILLHKVDNAVGGAFA